MQDTDRCRSLARKKASVILFPHLSGIYHFFLIYNRLLVSLLP